MPSIVEWSVEGWLQISRSQYFMPFENENKIHRTKNQSELGNVTEKVAEYAHASHLTQQPRFVLRKNWKTKRWKNALAFVTMWKSGEKNCRYFVSICVTLYANIFQADASHGRWILMAATNRIGAPNAYSSGCSGCALCQCWASDRKCMHSQSMDETRLWHRAHCTWIIPCVAGTSARSNGISSDTLAPGCDGPFPVQKKIEQFFF